MRMMYNPVAPVSITPGWWTFLGGPDRDRVKDEEVGSPLWMLYRGLYQIATQRPAIDRLQRYWQGEHDYPDTLDEETKQRYRLLVEKSRINYMRTVVDVIGERLKVQGLWLPGDDERADSDTWKLWTANDLDAWQSVAFQEMLAKRRVYWSVWPGAEGEPPVIELEDALQTWVEMTPGSRSKPAFAVKVWTDEWTGDDRAEVATDTEVHYFSEVVKRSRSGKTTYRQWEMATESKPNPLGEVPFVVMANRPTLTCAPTGYSVIEDVLDTQDRLNQTVLGRMLAGHTAAFMQKWATGIEIEDDDDGNPVAPFKPGVTTLFTSESEDAKFGQFDATDLKNYITGEEQEIQHIANTTRLPRHYLNPTGQAPSGDAMRSAEAALVSTVGTIQAFSNGPIKRMLSLARKAAKLGDTPFESEIVWADPEYQTYAQLVDGTTKLVGERIASRRWAREKVGMSPATITRVESELEEEALLDALLAPEDESPIQESAPPAEGA